MIIKSIFRNYDIRGRYPYQINTDIAYKIGYVFAKQYLDKDNGKVIIAYDGRNHSPKLATALSGGLKDGGAEITSIGLAPSPALYYAAATMKPAAAIMITASHNPKKDNGFKIVKDGKPFFGKDIEQLYYDIISHESFAPNHYKPPIKNIDESYITTLLLACQRTIAPNIKCVWDAGNGSTSNIVKKLLPKLPNKNWAVNCHNSSTLAPLSTDPTSKIRLEHLGKEVTKHDADIGISFDEDGDRICVMTSKGELLQGDQLLALFSQELLNRHAGCTIIADIKTSQVLLDYITSIGGKPLICKTGHPWIKSMMQERKALLGGEVSGHIYFADSYYGYDDGIYAALRLLTLLSSNPKMTIEERLSKLPISVSTPEIVLLINENKRNNIIAKIKTQLLVDCNYEQLITIDGLRAHYKNGWWLLRNSNTSSALIARYEGKTEKDLQDMQSKLNSYLTPHGIQI